MKGWIYGLGFAIATAAAWLSLPGLPWPARLLTIFLVIILPALLLLQEQALRTMDLSEVPRGAVYLSSSIALWVLGGITLAAALAGGFTWRDLGLAPLPLATAVGWSTGLVVAGLLITAAGKVLGIRETPLTEHVLPQTGREQVAFIGVSFTAGVCEEFVFRSFLIPALLVATGSLWLSVALSSVVFGFLHGYQGLIGILRTGLLGLLLALPFVLTGSILPSMIAHFSLNVIIGILMADWLRRE